jgi:acyl-CoA synthetase (NDP forming)
MSGRLRESHVINLNKLFPSGAIKIEKNIKQGGLKSGRSYSFVVFRFEKERKTIHALFIRDHDKLTDNELLELGIRKGEAYHLDYTGLEGIWFVNPAAVFAVAEADRILSAAQDEGRDKLYEHEVYQILAFLGIKVPEYTLIKYEKDVAIRMPDLPKGDKLVVKIVTQTEHKLELGGSIKGVQIINRHDAENTIREMFRIKEATGGVAVYEYVEKVSEEAELLIGISEAASGTSIRFGKGGANGDTNQDQMCHQAINILYDVENMIRSTVVGNRIASGALPLQSADLVRTIESFIEFKKVYDEKGKFRIYDLEVNPFICTPEGRFIACDGVLKFGKKQKSHSPKSLARIKRMFSPKSVAIIGASEKGLIQMLMDNVIRSAGEKTFKKEDIHLVNPKYAGKFYKGLPYLESMPENADLYVICMSPDKSTDVTEKLLAKGKCVMIITGGFGEVETGETLNQRLIWAVENSSGGAVSGPNTMGLLVTTDEGGIINLTFASPETGINVSADGDMAILCQSGGSMVGVLNYLRGVKIKHGISMGNTLDVGAADLLDHVLRNDPDIKTVGLYIEALKDAGDADRLLKLIGEARQRGVRVVIRKGGLTAKGGEATQTHTGRSAGKFECFKSVFEQAGAVVVSDFEHWIKILELADRGKSESFESFLEGANVIIGRGSDYAAEARTLEPVFSSPGKKIPADNKIFSFTTAGEDAVTIVDHCGKLKIVQPNASLGELLRGFNLQASIKNPFDLTGAGTNEHILSLLEYLVTWNGCDMIVAGYLPWVYSPDEKDVAHFIKEVSRINRATAKPIVFVIKDFSDHGNMVKGLLRECGIPVFDTVESCMRALNAVKLAEVPADTKDLALPEFPPPAKAKADRIHDENMKVEYMPTIPDKTILCHIITDSIIPVEQQNMLKIAFEQNMEKEAGEGTDYREGFACLSGANAGNPDEYIKDLQSLIQKKRDDYRAMGYTGVRFNVACPDTGLVSAILKNDMKVKAVAFEPCRGVDFNLIQVEGIMLALRALDSGDIEKLKSVFVFLAGNSLSSEQSAITDIDKFVKTVPFILPAAKVKNYDERRKINDLITTNIKQAA